MGPWSHWPARGAPRLLFFLPRWGAGWIAEYGEPADGQELSYLSKLVRGMPKRLAKCRARKYGRCGK